MDQASLDALLAGQQVDPGTGYATVAPSSVPQNVSAGFDPSAVTPGASSWTDVLQYGITRLIDAKTTPPPPANTTPQMTPSQALIGASVPASLARYLPWLIIVGVGWFAFKELRKG